MAQFFWENTFRVRVFSDIADGDLWAIVANLEPSLVLGAFLESQADDLGPGDVEHYEEMRRQALLASSMQLSAQSRTCLEALPRGIVSFRRLEFAVFDDWGHYAQIQPGDQLRWVSRVSTTGDAGLQILLA
jgi:hypothetical protein